MLAQLTAFSMPRSRADLLRLVAVCTLFCVTVSAALTCLYALALDMPIGRALAPAIAIPLLLTPLTSWAIAKNMMKLHEARAELERLARTDPLTGALNRRGFLELAGQAFERRREAAGPHLILLDIDRFKDVNDNHGHAAGDAAIVQMVVQMRETFEPIGGCVGRMGGDELAVLLSGASAGVAAAAAEALRAAIERRPVCFGEWRIRATVSVGVATAFDDDEDLDAVLLRADRALYAAKSTGRNRVCAAPRRSAA